MRRNPTVVLAHHTPTGTHYDWLFERRGVGVDPERPLACFRLERPMWQWGGRAWTLQRIADHRRRYLAREGPIGPGPDGARRGSVRRLDAGWLLLSPATDPGAPGAPGPAAWVVDMQCRRFTGRLALRRLAPGRWVGWALPRTST